MAPQQCVGRNIVNWINVYYLFCTCAAGMLTVRTCAAGMVTSRTRVSGMVTGQ